jgi:DNA-binding NarL/FixJ family response regulator
VRVLEGPDEVMAIARSGRVRIILLESPLPSELRALAGHRTPVIVLDEQTSPEHVAQAFALGAEALLPKNASLSDLLRAIRAALEHCGDLVPLTDRQHEVLGLIADGLDNAQIAATLGISQRTARAHVSSVLERLGVENRTQAAVMAVRRGYIE